jgi:predicted Fe-Mo cluster-binding NifX family protein
MTATAKDKTHNENTVRIAVPVADGRLHGHFGGCREFVFVDADTQSLTVLATQTMAAPPHTPGAFPKWLREQGVRVVIVGGIGKRALDIFSQHGIVVVAGEVDAHIDVLIATYLAGMLTGSPVGCEHHGHQHDHDPGHHHEHDHSRNH